LAIRKLLLTQPRPVVFSGDDALDRPEREDFPKEGEGDAAYEAARATFDEAWKRYEATYDVSVLPLRSGCQPTLFMVASLTTKQQAVIASCTRWGDVQLETLAYGVHDIRNLRSVDEAGTETTVKVERLPSDAGPRLPDEVLALFVDDGLRMEIWARVKEANSLSKEDRKSR
jgi:hypothetical protein